MRSAWLVHIPRLAAAWIATSHAPAASASAATAKHGRQQQQPPLTPKATQSPGQLKMKRPVVSVTTICIRCKRVTGIRICEALLDKT